MEIYFAGSIRGGRQDAILYSELTGFLKCFGKVLTEHIGDIELTASGDEGSTDRIIYDRDIEWLLSADIVVAEVTVISLGVGFEIGRAVAAGKTVICLYRETPGRKLSAMISGCPDIIIIRYENINEVKGKITKTFNNITSTTKL